MKSHHKNSQTNHSSTTYSPDRKMTRIGLTLGLTAIFLASMAAPASACTKVSAPKLAQISAGSTEVWGLDAVGDVYQYNSTTKTFNVTSGNLDQISVGPGESVWGLKGDKIYKYNFKTKSFTVVKGSLDVVSAGASGIWGVNESGGVFSYNGVAFIEFTNGAIPSSETIAVGENAPWILDAGGHPWLYNTTTGYFDETKSSTLVLKQISVGSDLNAWGVDYSNEVWLYNVNTEYFDLWPGVSLAQVSLFNDDTPWGVTPAGYALKFTGTGFAEQCPAVTNFSQISAGGTAAGTWGLTTTGGVYLF